MAKLNQSGLLFFPKRWQRVLILRWLKRTHAWTGFWGALLFLMLGVSGVLLNHRDIWKIDTGKPEIVSALDISVPVGLIADADALGRWAQKELDLTSKPRPSSGGGKSSGGKTLLGQERVEAEKWTVRFYHPNGRVSVEHIKGSNSVWVEQNSQNALGFIKNLHKSTGAGLLWVLLMDSIAGALIVMSLTGFILWTRLHGTRLVASGIVLTSLGLGIAALWPHML